MLSLYKLLDLSAKADRMLPATEREELLRDRKGIVPVVKFEQSDKNSWASLKLFILRQSRPRPIHRGR
jgi:hypothetical protein